MCLGVTLISPIRVAGAIPFKSRLRWLAFCGNMSDLPARRRAVRFTDAEIATLVHEVKEREVAIYGTAAQPPRLPAVRRAWEEVTAAVVASSGISRSVDQIKKRFSDLRMTGKRKVN